MLDDGTPANLLLAKQQQSERRKGAKRLKSGVPTC
jgi:hypothetical protein